MKIIRPIILFIGSIFFERRYMEHIAGEYIIRGILGKLGTFLPGDLPWPAHPCCRIDRWRNIEFCPEDVRIFQMPGTQFGAIGKITIGRGTYIARNVGLITANHIPGDLEKMTVPEPIVIGEGSWIGMNAIVLPGVTLGPKTTVGAGAVVTKSFPEGHCIIAGNPARKIKSL